MVSLLEDLRLVSVVSWAVLSVVSWDSAVLFSRCLYLLASRFSAPFRVDMEAQTGLSSHHSYLSKRINCSITASISLTKLVFARNRPFRSATLGRAIPVQSRRCNRQLEYGRFADIALTHERFLCLSYQAESDPIK